MFLLESKPTIMSVSTNINLFSFSYSCFSCSCVCAFLLYFHIDQVVDKMDKNFESTALCFIISAINNEDLIDTINTYKFKILNPINFIYRIYTSRLQTIQPNAKWHEINVVH
jgi:hypothetical protein